MKVISRIICVIIVLLFQVSCVGNKVDTVFVEINTDEYREITDSETKIKIEEISEYLRDYHEVSGDIEDNLKIDIILGNKELNKEGVELVHIFLDYKWLDGYIIYKNNEIVGLLSGMTDNGLIMTDLNHDGNKEVVYKSEIGSGMRTIFISAFDFESSEVLNVSYYNKNDGIEFVVTGDRIAVYSYYYDFERMSEEPIGYLELTDEGLIIEGVASTILKLDKWLIVHTSYKMQTKVS